MNCHDFGTITELIMKSMNEPDTELLTQCEEENNGFVVTGGVIDDAGDLQGKKWS